MNIDGKKIAEDIYGETAKRVASLSCTPVLTIITCAPTPETKRYLALKERKATQVGIETRIVELLHTSVTEDFRSAIDTAQSHAHGIIVQLPLPEHIDAREVLAYIPPSHDVDALNPLTTDFRSPVVDAFREVLSRNHVTPRGKHVTIIGSGRLVGLPAYHWFQEEGAFVSVVTKDTPAIEAYTKTADIVVCGAGVPGLLTPDMIKDGVVVLDAGTSEDGGELRGDADPACASKASLFTPVPGGIGPVTIAILLAHVVDCAIQGKSMV